MNLVALLHERAALHPERVALIEAGTSRSVSYGELADRVGRGAATLHGIGLREGNTILIFQPVSVALYEIVLAALHAGLRVMLADPSAGEVFLGKCCERLTPDALFGPAKAHLLRVVVPRMRRIRVGIHSSGWWPGSKRWRVTNPPAPLAMVTERHPALITFTSGSTGVPKAAVRTHGFLLAQHRVLAEALDFKDGEVDLTTLPVFVLANLASGLTSILAPPGTEFANSILKFHPTRCAASPAFFESLLSRGLPPFTKIFLGGAPVFPDLLARLRAFLPAARVEAVYGSTEAEPITHASAAGMDSEINATISLGGGLFAGTTVPGIDLRILRDQWGSPLGPLGEHGLADLTVSTGQAGEIVVAGEHVLTGYLDGVGDAETKIHVGSRVWHRTGDAGWIDSTGRLWLLGRCGEKLPPFPAPAGLPADALNYPFAIECAIRSGNPELRTAAIGWRDRRVLIVAGPADAAMGLAIRNMAAERFGIEEVVFVEELPLDHRHRAKIDYPALREMLAARESMY